MLASRSILRQPKPVTSSLKGAILSKQIFEVTTYANNFVSFLLFLIPFFFIFFLNNPGNSSFRRFMLIVFLNPHIREFGAISLPHCIEWMDYLKPNDDIVVKVFTLGTPGLILFFYQDTSAKQSVVHFPGLLLDELTWKLKSAEACQAINNYCSCIKLHNILAIIKFQILQTLPLVEKSSCIICLIQHHHNQHVVSCRRAYRSALARKNFTTLMKRFSFTLI